MRSNSPSSFDLSYGKLQSIVARFARFALYKSKSFMPQAPDREYVEQSLLECWENRLFTGQGIRQLVQEIENSYRVGVPVIDLVSHTVNSAEKNLKERGNKKGHSINNEILEPRSAYKYIIELLTYRRLLMLRSNPSASDANILDTLPPAQGSMFASYLTAELGQETANSHIVIERIVWLGSQNALAALLATLKGYQWILTYMPYKTIKATFTETDTIDTVLRPDMSDGEPLYSSIPTMNFKFFEGIKPNPKPKL